MGSPAAGPPSPGLIFDTLLAYERTAALKAAIDLDLFRAIGEDRGLLIAAIAQIHLDQLRPFAQSFAAVTGIPARTAVD